MDSDVSSCMTAPELTLLSFKVLSVWHEAL
jgi:hypothetical protein